MAIDRFRFRERTSGTIEGDIVDRAGTPVPASALTAATLTLYDWETGANSSGSPRPGIINSRDEQDILQTHNVTIDSAGHFIWNVQPEDNIIVTDRRQIERHRAMFLFEWDASGASPPEAGQLRLEVELEVVNLRLAA